MNIEDCKIGMKVQFKGTVIKNCNDITSNEVVRVRSDENGQEAYIVTNLITPISNSDIEIGTKVQFKGTIIKGPINDCAINSVRVRGDENGQENYVSADLLTPVITYDPTRKFRKGDLVKITGYYGRLFGCELSTELNDFVSIGSLVYLEEDEIAGDVLLLDSNLAGHYYRLSVACIELVKPIEEIEEEHK